MKFLAVFVALAVASGHAVPYTWTLHELSTALQNPATEPALIPYLEQALNEMMNALYHGQQMDSITVQIPDHIDVWPIQDHHETDDGAQPGFIDVWPIKEPALVAAAASSPLVQIIVNAQQKSQVDVAFPDIAADSEIIPTTVSVVEEAFVPEFNPPGQWGGGWGPMI